MGIGSLGAFLGLFLSKKDKPGEQHKKGESGSKKHFCPFFRVKEENAAYAQSIKKDSLGCLYFLFGGGTQI